MLNEISHLSVKLCIIMMLFIPHSMSLLCDLDQFQSSVEQKSLQYGVKKDEDEI